MAHYAFIKDGLVSEVIVGKDENDIDTLPDGFTSWEEYYQTKRENVICKRTSYNTFGNQHNGDGTPLRGNYAGIGFKYDAVNDVFIPPQPYNSWVLNENTWLWEAPIARPDDPDTVYIWDENLYNGDTNNPKTLGWVVKN